MVKISGRRLADEANSPAQRTVRTWEQAYESLKNCPTDHLRHETKDGSSYVISPSITETIEDSEGNLTSHNFAIAGRLKTEGKMLTEDDALFIIVDGVVTRPAVIISKGSVSPLPIYESGEDGQAVNTVEADHITGLVIEEVERLGAAQRKEHEATLRGKKERRQKRVARSLQSLVAIVVIAAAATGGVVGLRAHQKSESDKQAQAQAEVDAANKAHWDAIAAYDAKGIVLQSELVTADTVVGEASLDRPALLTYSEAPPFGALLDDPRSLEIAAGNDRLLGVIPPDKGVRAVSDAPQGHVTLTYLETGEVWISALSDGDASSGEFTDNYKVLVQTLPLPK